MTRYPIGRKANRKVVVEPHFCRPQADAAKKIGNFIHKIHNNYDPFKDVPLGFLNIDINIFRFLFGFLSYYIYRGVCL